MVFSREELNQLYRYALSLAGNPDDGYDLLQTALEKLLSSKSLPNYSLSYTRAIIRNQFIDQCRRQNVVAFEQLQDENLSLLSTNPLEEVIINEDQVERMMSQLEPAERECLFLWAVLGYTAAEIATETNEARGTVLSRLYRVKQKANALVEKMNNSANSSKEANHD
ncbi:MAG: RNA polymerase sigma factor [Pseudomonadales bacterium]|nr:RNA polymerase sigma factor [Pseudomonadales bacterium]